MEFSLRSCLWNWFPCGRKFQTVDHHLKGCQYYTTCKTFLTFAKLWHSWKVLILQDVSQTCDNAKRIAIGKFQTRQAMVGTKHKKTVEKSTNSEPL